MKRPLGCACLFFILFIRLFYVLFPPVYTDYSSLNGRELYINGQIADLQIQQEAFVCTLTKVSLTDKRDSGEHNSDFHSKDNSIIYNHDKIYCNFPNTDIQLHIGERIWLKGTFVPYSQAENMGQFDSRLYYHIRGVGAKIEHAQLIYHDGSRSLAGDTLFRIKSCFINKLNMYFSEQYSGIMKNILLGDASGMDTQIKQLFREGGILHILSISGTHISMLGMGFVKMLRKCGLDKKSSAAAGFFIVLAYGMMIGTTASAFRAICMFGFQMAAILLGRTYDRLTGLAVAAALLLLEQPMYVFYSGFLLSFGAVLGITVITPVLTELARKKGRFVQKAVSIFSGGIGILLVTFPIQVCYFYEYPVYSMLVNVCILPFLNGILVLGAAVLAIPMRCSVLAVPFVQICQAILYGYEWICMQSQRLPFHSVVIGVMKPWQLVLYYAFLAGVLWLVRQKQRHTAIKTEQYKNKAQFVLTAMTGCAVMGLCLYRPVYGLTCRFLSVGQGDCMVLQYGSQTYVVDCGSSSKKKAGTNILLPCLKYYGVSKVDGVFLSHADADHINGITDWLEEYEHSHVEIACIILPDLAADKLEEEFAQVTALARKQNIPIVTLAAGDSLVLGELCIEVLNPKSMCTDTEDANAYSQVLCFCYAGKKVLMTGDIGAEQEEMLLKEALVSQEVTILKAAHHGSKYSNCMEFLDAVKPEYIICSYGIGNRYGHPHRETLERIAKTGAKVWYTGKNGMIECILTKHGQSFRAMLE